MHSLTRIKSGHLLTNISIPVHYVGSDTCVQYLDEDNLKDFLLKYFNFFCSFL